MSLEILHQCKFCFKLSSKLWSYSVGVCSYACMKGYDERAERLGGYHIMAREDALTELRERNRNLEARLADQASKVAGQEPVRMLTSA